MADDWKVLAWEILNVLLVLIALITDVYLLRTRFPLSVVPKYPVLNFSSERSEAVPKPQSIWNNSQARSIEPVMSAAEKQLFYRYLDRCRRYFEFGSGGSTAQAAVRVPVVISVESDAKWHRELRRRVGPAPNVWWYTVDLHSPKNVWGYPGKSSRRSDWVKYTHAYKSKYAADLILIDGRFRVSCALCVFSQITRDTTVIIHDFMNRRQYWVILRYYDLVEFADSLAVLKKKNGVPPAPRHVIAWYDTKPKDHLLPGLYVPGKPVVTPA
jgi:hypothetical protein